MTLYKFVFLWTVGTGLFLIGCSAPPLSMKCQEIRTRLEMQDLSADQKRFAEEELKDCEKQLNEARHQDSTTVEKLENHFSPEDSL